MSVPDDARSAERDATAPGAPRMSVPPARGEVRIFWAHLAPDPSAVHRAASLLSDDERARAAAYAFPHLRSRWTVARAFLRAVLGDATARAPHALAFSLGPHGKPAVVDAPPWLRFNLSHSDDLALLTVTRDAEIGADVERARPFSDADALVARYFSAGERRAFAALPAAERHAAFFRLWTRKEAMLKALGTGLATPLDAIELSLDDAAPRLHELLGDRRADARWQLLDVPVPQEGFAAAVAVARLPDAPTAHLVITRPGDRSWI